MRTATALAAVEPIRGQIPLPFPRTAARVIPMPVQRAGTDDATLRQRAPRLMQAVVEVLAGRRAPRQLEPWFSPGVFTLLQRRVRAGAPRAVGRTARLASLHIGEVTDGVAEVAGRIVIGDRSRAVAMRLERMSDHHGHTDWRCTALVWG